MSTANIYADLPKIIFINHIDDNGPDCDASCPHCGALGRYIYWFTCEDGSERGAMAGCFKHFPQHEFVKIHQQIVEKERSYKAKGWTLASWDVSILETIKDYAEGKIPEWQARNIVHGEQSRKRNYARRKFGRR